MIQRTMATTSIRLLLAVLSLSLDWNAALSPPFVSIRSSQLTLGQPIGNGTFGTVHWGQLASAGITSDTELVVAKNAEPANSGKQAKQKANAYLDTEAHLNRRLCLEGSNSRYVAPYVGECTQDEKRYLLWRASGNYTLQQYIDNIDNSDDRRDALSQALDVSSDDLPRELLRQLLSAISFCHSLGVVHRDLKPANILVDETTHCLRLIDFGSACDMGSWVVRRGYSGPEKGPLSVLYCAPEEFVVEDDPYSFDVYSAAICWLATLVPGLAKSEDALWDFRIAVRDHRHDLLLWEEDVTLTGTLPDGWEELFACEDGIKSWRLLVDMLQYEAKKRPSASEALLGKYLNPRCQESGMPTPPAKPWSLASQLERLAKEDDDECEVTDLYTRVISVELHKPIGIILEEASDGRGAVVTGLTDDQAHLGLVSVEDALLAIGPIDVENATFDHILEMLESWPSPTMSLQFLRPI